MDIKKASTESDFKEVESFLETQEIPLPPVQLKNRFKLGYEKFINLISPNHETWILKDHNKTVATGTINFKSMKIEGFEQNVGITSFMRVKPDAKSTLLWTKYLLPSFAESIEKMKCKYVFSFVFYSFRSEIRKFRQAIKFRDEMPRYYLVRKASYITIHGRIPWKSKALKSIHIRKANPGDIPQILEFISLNQADRHLTQTWDKDKLAELIRRGTHDRNSLWIAIDSQAKVVGHFLPIEMSHFREDIITAVTPEVQNYFYIQKFFSFFGLATPTPKFGKPMPTLYLSFFEASNLDIFETMLRHVYKFLRHKKENISYTHFAGNLISRPPSCFLFGALSMDFYLILPPNQDPPDFLKSYWLAPIPEFEAISF